VINASEAQAHRDSSGTTIGALALRRGSAAGARPTKITAAKEKADARIMGVSIALFCLQSG
jgi:hypothetical protein